MEPEQLKALIKVLEELNEKLNNDHNTGGFESATTSTYNEIKKLINKLKG